MLQLNQISSKKWLLICIALAPSFLFGIHYGYWVALEMMILSSSFYRPQRKLRWGIAAILCQELVIMIGFYLLYHSLGHPIVFALACTIWAGLSMGLIIHGKHLRSLASWVLIPSLYFAIDFKDSLFIHSISHNWLTIAQLLVIAALGPVIVCVYKYVTDKNGEYVLWGFNGALRPHFDSSSIKTILALMVAVFITSLIVWWFKLPHGEWIIWSTASVSTGQTKSMHKKIFHRGSGALIGVVVGISMVFALQGYSPIIFEIAALLIPFTLFIDAYPVAFASRCTLIALAAGTLPHSEFEAGYRMLNVFIGCIASALCAYVIFYIFNHFYHNEDQSKLING